jgi:Ca2+:H+ antiporter
MAGRPGDDDRVKLRRPSILTVMLVFVPGAGALHFLAPGHDALVFGASCLAVIPLAGYMGRSTHAIAARAGSALGSFLSAAFGNAAELILAIAALRAGEEEVVKASLTGSMIGNLLLVLGAAVVAGGLKKKSVKLNVAAASAGSASLYLAAVGLLIPALMVHTGTSLPHDRAEGLSIGISVILLVVYGLTLLFSLKTHSHLFEVEIEEQAGEGWSLRTSIVVLVLAAVAVAGVSELLVESIAGTASSLGLSRLFIGVVVVAIVGNAAEHSTAVIMALRGKMDLALNISTESSRQVALFVAPVLVLVGLVIGQPMELVFTPLEVVAVGTATGAATLIALDGETNWLEGVMLLGVYAVLGVAFFFA